MQHDHIDFRLKNVNEVEVKKVWRYQAWDSCYIMSEGVSTLSVSQRRGQSMLVSVHRVAREQRRALDALPLRLRRAPVAPQHSVHAVVGLDDHERVQRVRRAPPREQPLPEAPAAVATVARVDEKVHNLRRALELQLGRV